MTPPDPAPRRTARGTLVRERPQADGLALEILPVRLPAAWLAVTVMLGAMFGLPALAVLISPSRWDPLGLAAMAAGFAVAGWAGTAAVRARAARRPQRLLLDAAGIAGGARALRWAETIGVEAVAPSFGGAGTATGASAMGLRIAAERAAQEWRVVAATEEGGRVLLARGLDQAAAERIAARIEAARPQPSGARGGR